MITSLLAGASIYITGVIIDASYRLIRISELKIDFDSTRSKDVKNECVALARHHMHGLRTSALWPRHILVGTRAALSWGRSLDSK